MVLKRRGPLPHCPAWAGPLASKADLRLADTGLYVVMDFRTGTRFSGTSSNALRPEREALCSLENFLLTWLTPGDDARLLMDTPLV